MFSLPVCRVPENPEVYTEASSVNLDCIIQIESSRSDSFHPSYWCMLQIGCFVCARPFE